MTARRALLYARVSIATEESVSIDRQLASARKYAEARGWQVLAEMTDDGVSASKKKPEERVGWRRVLDHHEPFEVVVVWKVDRLARSVLDFLHADQMLTERGAGLVSVEDNIDMTTDTGRAMAQMMAVFGEMEARQISARVRAARTHLIASGRVVGGRLPYGWTSERRADGGRYLVQDPERIEFVRTAAKMIREGKTVTAVCAWLDSVGAPLPPSAGRTSTHWNFSTVAGLLRNPVLYGATLDNPGNRSKHRGPDVRRDASGMPILTPSVAIMTPADHRELVALLDARERPRASAGTSPLFSRLVTCGHCDRVMHRTRKRDRESLVCPGCTQTVATRQLAELVEQRLMLERGGDRLPEYEEVDQDDPANLLEIEHALREIGTKFAQPDADIETLVQQREALLELQHRARTFQPVVRQWRWTDRTVREAWEAAADDLTRRELLSEQVDRLEVHRGRVGRKLDESRVRITWREPQPVAMTEGPTIADLHKVFGTPSRR